MIYILILLVLGILAVVENSYSFADYEQIYVSIRKYINIKRVIYAIIGIFLIGFAGFRYETGFDFVNYVRIFERTTRGERYLGVERAYYYLNVYLHKLTDNYMWVFFIMALVTLGIKFLFIERINSKMENTILFSLFIYFAMYFLVYDMGQIRSSFAQGMGLIAIFLYIKGYKKSAIIPILIGTSIHTSCIILLLMYVLGEKRFKATTMIILYIIFLGVGQYLNLTNISHIVSLTNNEAFIHKFSEYTTDPKFAQKIGLSLNLLFQAFVLVLAVFARWYYKIRDKKFDFMLNMYLVGACLYLLFNNYFVIGVRLAAYFNLAIIFIIPKMVSKIRNKWLRMAIVLGFVIIMSVMVIRELHVHADLFLPYKMKFLDHIYHIK